MFDEGGLAESEQNYHIIAEWRCPNTRSVDRSFGGDPYSAPRACKTVFEITRSVLTAVALMDAHRDMGLVNPFDFAAKMWNHAPAMVAAQEEAFGEQIYFTGQELADIIAFMHDDSAQHSFTEHDLTPQAQKMMHHEHGGQSGPAAHAEEVGHKPHKHAPGTPAHND